MKTRIFTEENYTEKMNGEAALWRDAHMKQLRFRSPGGTRLHSRYAVNPDARGAVVLEHGFTEYAEKFLEMMYYFYQEGYSVFMYDQRGHGRSGRKIADENLVYVASFDEYTSDLEYFIDHVVKKQAPGLPLLLFGHSMGGCVSALFVEQHPDVFRGAVLSSPMLKMAFGDTPELAVRFVAAFSNMAGWNARGIPGTAGFKAEPDFEHSCATSKARYLYHFDEQVTHRAYQTTGATYGWARAALRATDLVMKDAAKAAVPILLCQAGQDQLVDNAAQDRFAMTAPDVTLVRFPTAKHEIYRSTEDVLQLYYETILNFFDSKIR